MTDQLSEQDCQDLLAQLANLVPPPDVRQTGVTLDAATEQMLVSHLQGSERFSVVVSESESEGEGDAEEGDMDEGDSDLENDEECDDA